MEITANYSDVPVGASTSFCTLKYNKSKHICFDVDDSSPTVKNMFNKLKSTYSTNGAGSNKNFSLGVAVNGYQMNGNTLQEIGLMPDTYLTYAERLALIPFGLDVMPHGMFHDPVNGSTNPDGPYFNNPVKSMIDLDALILSKMGYQCNAIVVPTNYAGFMDAAAEMGYITGDSEGTFDNQRFFPEFNPLGSTGLIRNYDVYTALKRGFTDVWNNSGSQWELINNLFSDSTKNFFTIGTHGIAQSGQEDNFISWIDSIKTQGGDNVMMTSLREFMEYQYVKKKVLKFDTIEGNTLKINIDYTPVANEKIRWHDLSLTVAGSGTLTGVTCDDSDFTVSFNPTTRLINVEKQKISWSTPVIPDPDQTLMVKRAKFVI